MKHTRQPLRLLVVGESRADANLIASSLGESGHATRLAFAENEAGVLECLSGERYDIIVAQRSGGRLPALLLLELLRKQGIDTPVIVFSDEHTDEDLVEIIRAGARDCLGRRSLGRLRTCVERELRGAEDRRAAATVLETPPEDRHRALVEEIPALIYAAWADDVGTRAYLSPQLQAMTGFEPVEWLAEGDAWARHLHPEDRERVLSEFRQSCMQGQTFLSDYRVRCRDGGFAWWHDQGWVVRDADGHATFVRGVVQDITETIRRERYYDLVTGLPNRELLRERLVQALTESTRDAKPLALLILALERFDEINNTLGQKNGEGIVRELAQRLEQVLGERERAARLRGDEFGVLLPDSDVALARHVGEKILGLFERPFMVENLSTEVAAGVKLPIEVGASVGIAAAPEHGQEADRLLRRADLAVRAAKEMGSGCVVYSEECDPYDPHRLPLLGELRPAIEANQLFLCYQPKVDLQTRAVVGAEALLRWRHPKRGLVPPMDFIPLAEQAGVIKPLTWWVLEQAVKQCRAWDREGLDVAVNLSARSLHDPQLTERIKDLLDDNKVPARRLQLEVTEHAIMTDRARAAAVLGRLKALGVGVSIDDFGTGYSSLAHLRTLPVSEIKIDKSFVIGMGTNGGPDKAIVRSTSELGHNLGLNVVAEGVENEEAIDLLRSYGCDLAQGYYIAKPMAADAFAAWRAASPWQGAGS
jgi:diguanylate cyclase (GGDEF)-like protein/PAS domain S-box-containing protein